MMYMPALLRTLQGLGYAIPAQECAVDETAAAVPEHPDDLPSDVVEQVRHYARFHGIDPTLDVEPLFAQVSRSVARARCALPDVAPARGGALCKWETSRISARITFGKIGGMQREAVHGAFGAALVSLQDVCGVEFRVITAQTEAANILLKAGKIDGKSGTLAWSELPCGGFYGPGNSLEQLYDTAEPWSAYGQQYFQAVFAHELGHALGLDHLPAGNLMQPYIREGLYLPQPGDIAELQRRYGPPVPKPIPPPPPTDGPVEFPLIQGFVIPDGPTAGRYDLIMRRL